MTRLSTVLVIAALSALSSRALAQTADTAAKQRKAAADSRDTVFLRARRLVLEGNGAAGRALVDSALTTAAAGTSEYATALYWRGALSSTAADAERDYRRVIVEYPFSPHSGDALLALAQLEMARGDREPAIDHLERFLLQRPNDSDRVRAGIWLGRTLLEQNQLAKGCAVLLRTRASLGDSAVEVRNQVDYYAARCDGVDTVSAPARSAPQPAVKAQRADSSASRRAAPRDSVAKRTPTPRDSTKTDSARRTPARRDSARPDSTRPRRGRDSSAPSANRAPPPVHASDAATPPNGDTAAGRFTVQVAAYETRQSAEQLVVRLAARGVVARTVASQGPPYRVRVGHYPTDAAATTAARSLKEKGIAGFVTTTDNESATAPVRR